MTGGIFRFTARRAADSSLAQRVALLLLVKALGLTAIWLLFVRDQRVAVDAQATAAAFGLVDSKWNSRTTSEGSAHEQ